MDGGSVFVELQSSDRGAPGERVTLDWVAPSDPHIHSLRIRSESEPGCQARGATSALLMLCVLLMCSCCYLMCVVLFFQARGATSSLEPELALVGLAGHEVLPGVVGLLNDL